MDACLGMYQQTDVGGRRVGHEHRDGERTDPLEPLVLLDVPLAEQRVQTSDTGGAADHQTLGVDAVGVTGLVVGLGELQVGVGPGLLGCHQGKLAGTVQADVVRRLVHR